MARKANPKAKEAKALYLRGKKLKEIAELLGEPEGTIRRWKSTYGWGKNENERSESKANARNKEKQVAAEARQVLENSDLTDKQQLFCLYYLKNFNATRAYQRAYGCTYETAMTNGPALLRNTRVRDEITQLKKLRYNHVMLEPEDIFEKYMEIAFSDITDYVEFGSEEQPVIGLYGPMEIKDPETGKKKPLMQRVNTVYAKPSTEVDGTIISEVSQGRNGFKVKLMDRQKALDWLANHMDLATEEQKAKIENIRASTIRIKGEDPEEQWEDDGFLEALRGENPWADE